MECFISVIIPVYNGSKYLLQAMMSVLNQPYKDIELICINDGSTDNSLEILENEAVKDKRIKIFNQKNSGVAEARNRGILLSQGKYVAFLDQDDIWFPDALTIEVVNQIQSKDSDLVSFAYFDSNQDITRMRLFDRGSKFVESSSKYAYENYRHHSSYLYKRDFLQSNDIKVDEYRNEDERFRMQCMYLSKTMLYLSSPLFVYRNNKYFVTHSNIEKAVLTYISCIDGYELLAKNTTNIELKEYANSFVLHTLLEMFISFPKEVLKQESFNNLINEYNVNELLREIKWLGKDKTIWKMIFQNKILFFLKYSVISIFYNVLRFFRNITIVLNVYEIKKYPIDAKEVGL